MKTPSSIAEEVEKTLHAYDSDEALSPNPFLFTRLEAMSHRRMQGRGESLIAGFRMKIAVGILLLVANIVTTVYYYHWTDKKAIHEVLVSDLKADLRIDESQHSY